MMLSDHNIQTLRSITSIEALIAFVRRDLGWPIEDDDIEAITYEFQPEELSLKPEHFPKINSIRQLRPPSTEQPWGIFFIDFENKKIPLTVMRRILNHLALRRKAQQSGQAWNPGDLLFLTTYGEQKENAREVAFAHFHETPGDLPTLKVIQWDQDDTPAKLKNTYDTLRNNLQWPEETTSKEEWRHQWAAPFKHKPGHVITTAKQLAEALATLSKSIRRCVDELVEAEIDRGPLKKLYKAFQESLIHDLKPEDFSDTFAQTISYGLLMAAVSRTDMDAGNKGTALLTEDIANLVPVTNPFLKEILETFLDVGGRKKAGMDFDELGVQDVVELLRGDATDLPAVLRDFGNQKQGEDPVIHFYEDYLKAYNKELKVKRGVFYTPKPVVSYIVRSVHELLQTEFGLDDGLASTVTWGEMASRPPRPSEGEGAGGEGRIKIPEGTDPDSHFVTILDPATGTGTFLVEVIDVIWKHLQAKWAKSAAACWEMIGRQPSAGGSFQDFWNDYVADHLLPRLYGYELMMAPYAIAHMKLGLKLGETGYRFATDRRVRVYLTNALEPAHELAPRLIVDWEALAHEALAVKAVKETQRFTVVIGNPPYSKVSSNMSEYAQASVKLNAVGGISSPGYYAVDGVPLNERKVNLQDDYIKFLRLAQLLLVNSRAGIVGMITNHGYVRGPTFRGMRCSLADTFARVFLTDLHGDSNIGENAPQGAANENVFDIRQGVAVIVAIKLQHGLSTPIRFADIWGSRENKYEELASRTVAINRPLEVTPSSPNYAFSRLHVDVEDSYADHTSLSELLPSSASGIVTSRDQLVIGFTDEDVTRRIEVFLDPNLDDDAVAVQLGLTENYEWRVHDAREALWSDESWRSCFRTITYRPFDNRRICYHEAIVWRPRFEAMRDLLEETNVALIATRQSLDPYSHAFVTRYISEYKAGCHHRNSYSFPLLTHRQGGLLDGPGWFPNLSEVFLGALAGVLGRRFHFESAVSSEQLADVESVLAPDQGTLGGLQDDLGPAQGTLTETDAWPAFSPEDVFHYIYAVLHSPTYRTRYAEFLKIDFPRIPLPGGPEVFDALIPLGERLVALHLMEAPKPERWATTYRGPADPQVEKVSFTPNNDGLTGTVWLDKAQTRGFHGVPASTWNFHICGYQVCEKWLKDRGPKKGKPGRTLTPKDIEHYHYIAFALTETQLIMKQIDEAIERHGGWPGAFQGGA